jgi:hypothetical protein
MNRSPSNAATLEGRSTSHVAVLPSPPSSCGPYVWVWPTGTVYQLVAVWTERVYVATFVQTEHEQ